MSMVIFNSYVKLPEGSDGIKKELNSVIYPIKKGWLDLWNIEMLIKSKSDD